MGLTPLSSYSQTVRWNQVCALECILGIVQYIALLHFQNSGTLAWQLISAKKTSHRYQGVIGKDQIPPHRN